MRETSFSRRMKFLLLAAGLCLSGGGIAVAAAGPPTFLDQGKDWSPATRADFYSRDQGARMIPLAWLKALKTADGQPFLADKLARYGYLPNPASAAGLPIGFTAAGPSGSRSAGMTCAACHTRQISVEDKEYRVDGGPAITDFQAFLADLDAAVGRVLANEASFRAFAAIVLGGGAKPDKIATLREEIDLWYLREHSLMSRALPTASPWGLGRLDAVSMIFNRLTGLDLGPPPSYLIPGNIRLADAPVRYPFLWNAPVQDKTQWPGFADNGSNILGLSRNLGEVYGVFGIYRPKKEWWHLAGINFLNDNSANFDGLARLELLVQKIGPPKWPWRIDEPLAAQGKLIFAGACASCHGETPGPTRFPFQRTWATPVQDVGTDSRQYAILNRDAQTGVLEGAWIPLLLPAIQKTDTAFKLLAISVGGSILQNPSTFSVLLSGAPPSLSAPSKIQTELKGAFHIEALTPPPGQFKYESRVLHGIWATAPYLHNGSVPTLADLLVAPNERIATFGVGRYYDRALIGLARDQRGTSHDRATTGCEDRNSGNSHCGHDFGTSLPPDQKLALLEYLKKL
jgi:hypothetical protein